MTQRSVVSRKAAIRSVLDAWRARDWRESSSAAAAMVDAWADKTDMLAAVPAAFSDQNACAPADVARVAAAALAGMVIQRPLPTLIDPERIDSFRRVVEVSALDVAEIPRPLPIAEHEVKRMLLAIIGEPEAPGDWGGERSDAFTTNVYIDAQRTRTSFVLKGPAKRGELTPAHYGKNGDQLQRSFTQPATLHVVQANASLATSMRELLNGLVLDARSKGDSRAAATLWDGTDTARILAAYGYIHREDGRVLR
jgi:hypothetical protein